MTAYVGTVGSGQQPIISIYVGTVGSGQQRVLSGYVGTVGSGMQLFYSGLSVSLSPPSNSAGGTSFTFVFNPATTAIVSGGSGSYVYSWSLTNQSGGTWSFVSGHTGPSPVVQATASIGEPSSADLNVTVTDTGTGLTAPATCHLTYSRS
jgi:hypothetical protein